MKKIKSVKTIMKIVFVMAFVLAVGLQESRGHIITSGSVGSRIALGVNEYGHLNVIPTAAEAAAGLIAVNSPAGDLGDPFVGEVGIAYEWNQSQLDAVELGHSPGFYDATSPWRLFEGWGVSGFNSGDAGAGSGYVNGHLNSGVPVNLTLDSFTSSATTLTSVTSLTTGPALKVTQVYSASDVAPNRLFEDRVTIENIGGTTIDNVRYVRVMDWDVPQTEKDELVTIAGVPTTNAHERSHNGGFSASDPFGFEFAFNVATINVDFDPTGAGSHSDHGAYFRFNFGSLAAGAKKEFSVFYGAAENKFEMLAALQLEQVEIYSLGQSNITSPDLSPTYAFAFKDVEGIEIVHVIPEPGTFALLGIGLAGLGYFGRKRILKKK